MENVSTRPAPVINLIDNSDEVLNLFEKEYKSAESTDINDDFESCGIEDKENTPPPKTRRSCKLFLERHESSRLKLKKMVAGDKKLPGTCSVLSCTNNLIITRNDGLNVSYYRFPSDETVVAKWKEKCGLTDGMTVNMRTARVCSIHFKDEDFESHSSGGKRSLKPKAVPSLNLFAKKKKKKFMSLRTGPKKNCLKKLDPESTQEESTIPAASSPVESPSSDHAFIRMPKPICDSTLLDEVDIKSEPPSSENDSDDTDVYYPTDPEDEPSQSIGSEKTEESLVRMEGANPDEAETETAAEGEAAVEAGAEQDAEEESSRSGKKRKQSIAKPHSEKNRKCTRTASKDLVETYVSVEKLNPKVIEAANAGTLRVRVDQSSKSTPENDEVASSPPMTRGRKRRRRQTHVEKDTETPTKPKDEVVQPNDESKSTLASTPQPPKPTKRRRKVLKSLSEDEDEENVDDPESVSESAVAPQQTPPPPKRKRHRKEFKESDDEELEEIQELIAKCKKDNEQPAYTSEAIQVQTLLQNSTGIDLFNSDESAIPEDVQEQISSILDSNKTDREKIIQLVEQRISEHTRIIEGKAMGPQQLADHNKILQGSALVLRKLAEKTKKVAPFLPVDLPPSSNVTPTSTPSNPITPPVTPSNVTPKTIVLKKITSSESSSISQKILSPLKNGTIINSSNVVQITSPVSQPITGTLTAIPIASVPSATTYRPIKPNPVQMIKEDITLKDDDPIIIANQFCSPLEKIREYDNLMKKYLGVLLEKDMMAKKNSELKYTISCLESEGQERQKESDALKKKVASLNSMISQTHKALGSFLSPNQIKLALQETKKVAWTPEEMLTAFTIKHLSKACYLFLRHKLNYPLPGISSLQRWMTTVTKGKLYDGEEYGDETAAVDESANEDDETTLFPNEGGVEDEDEEVDEEVDVSDPLGDSSRDIIIEGTLEEINARGVDATAVQQPQSQPPYHVVFENNLTNLNSSTTPATATTTPTNNSSNRKVIILKKVGSENSPVIKSKVLINDDSKIKTSSERPSLVNGTERAKSNHILKLFPNAKTISVSKSASEVMSSNSVDKVTIQKIRVGSSVGSKDIKNEPIDILCGSSEQSRVMDESGHEPSSGGTYFSIEEINRMSDQVIIDQGSETHSQGLTLSQTIDNIVEKRLSTDESASENAQTLIHFSENDEDILKRRHYFPQITIEGKIENRPNSEEEVGVGNIDVMNISNEMNVLEPDAQLLKTLLIEQKRLQQGDVVQEDDDKKKVILTTADQGDPNGGNIVVYTMEADLNVHPESTTKVYILNENGEIVSNAECDSNMISLLSKQHEESGGVSDGGYEMAVDDDEVSFRDLEYKLSNEGVDHSYSLGFLEYATDSASKRPLKEN